MECIKINSENYEKYNYLIPEIKYCAEDKYIDYWQLRERTITEYEFIFVTKGTGQFFIEGNQYDVKQNDLILIHPSKWHYGCSENLPFHFLCIHFEIYAAKEEISSDIRLFDKSGEKVLTYSKALLEFPEYTAVGDSSYIHMLLRRIIREASTTRAGFDIIIKALFTDLLINLLRERNLNIGLENLPDHVEEVIDYIKSNYMNNIKLSNLSEYIHLQPSYVSNIFKKYTGFTVTDYIKYYRLLVAKNLMLETERKIEDIAHSVGFYDIHHFSRVFKEVEGLSPVQYRIMKRK